MVVVAHARYCSLIKERKNRCDQVIGNLFVASV
jgi:hypothetical protein